MRPPRLSMTALAAVLCGGLAAFGPSLVAQAPAQQAPPTFKAGTSLVEVDIIARDKDGRFVSGLTADDFDVLEEGKPQRIEHFYLVTEQPTASTEPAYSPENPVLDGKFRHIDLRVKWAGLTVRARRGYVASPLPPAKQLRTK